MTARFRLAFCILGVALLLVTGTLATAQVTFDAVGGGSAESSSLTFSHTTTANAGLIVGVSSNGSAYSTGVTYNGVAMTRQVQATLVNTFVELWWLATPASGAHNVVISFAGTTDVVGSSSSWLGVNSFGFTSSATGNGASPSVTVSSASGEVVVGAVSTVSNSALTSDQTQRFEGNFGSIHGGMSSTVGVASTVLSWTNANSSDWAQVALALKSGGADTIPPTNPTNLVATVIGSSAISLTWTASTDDHGIFNYRVEQAPFSGSCGTFVEVAASVPNAYTDSGLSASTAYCHRVRAFDGTNFSVGYSNTTTATTLAPRVATIDWNDNSPNGQNPIAETGFQLERCAGVACSNFAVLATLGANVTHYVDTTSPAPIAGYRVTAIPTGNGYANIIYTTPPSPPAVLSVVPLTATFDATVGANPPTQPLTISNGGGAGMAWTVSDNATWLSIAPSSGTDGAVLVITVNTAGLAAATYNATITVTASGANGSPATIPVTLNLTPVVTPLSGSSGRIR